MAASRSAISCIERLSSLGHSIPPLLTRNHELLVIFSKQPLADISKEHRATELGQDANASAKVLLFYEICKYFCLFAHFFVILSAERGIKTAALSEDRLRLLYDTDFFLTISDNF